MSDVLLGTGLLFAVSFFVRILPSVIRLPLNKERQQTLRQLLPVAVFINLVAYCLSSEAATQPTAALSAFAALFGLLTFLPRVGVLLSVVLSSAVYFTLMHLGAVG